MMQATLVDQNWQKFFDVIVMDAKKPLFMRTEGGFFEYDSYKDNLLGPKVEDLKTMEKTSKVNYFLQGNMKSLTKLFHSLTGKMQTEIVVMADDLFSDSYATYQFD